MYCITSASRRVDGKYGNHFKTLNDQKKPYDSAWPAQMSACKKRAARLNTIHLLQREPETLSSPFECRRYPKGQRLSNVTTKSATQTLHNKFETAGRGKHK